MIELTGTQYRENDIYKIYINKNIYILYTKERESEQKEEQRKERERTTQIRQREKPRKPRRTIYKTTKKKRLVFCYFFCFIQQQ